MSHPGAVLRTRAAAIAVSILVVIPACASDHPTGAPSGPFGAGVLTLTNGSTRVMLYVQVADTPQAWAQGLMGRRSLAPHEGMAFVFTQPAQAAFWMKDTLIPLTIAFWNEQGRVVAVLDMEPCRSDPCPLYTAGHDYVGAVEVSKGRLRGPGVAVGWTATLRRTTPA